MFSNIRCTIARPARLEHNFGMRSTSNITWIVSSQHVFCPIVRSLGEIIYTRVAVFSANQRDYRNLDTVRH